MSYGPEDAKSYAAQNEHALPEAEGRAWLALMAGLVSPEPLAGRVLDIGAGTGVLTAALKAEGLSVLGLELSQPMIDQGLAENRDLTAADFVRGDAEDGDLFAPGQFDWIVSRQMLCHLTDAERSFGAWLRWLKPGGRAILVDGFWGRSGWGEAALTTQPFAALTSAGPVARAMENAGFTTLRAGAFDEVNAARRAAFGDGATRYVVVARKD